MHRRLVAAVATAMLAGSMLVLPNGAAQAGYTYPLLVQHQVVTYTGAGAARVTRGRTVVTGISGIAMSHAATHRVIVDLNRRAAAFALASGPGIQRYDTTTLARYLGYGYLTFVQDRYLLADDLSAATLDNQPLSYLVSSGKLLTLRSFAAPGKLQALISRLSVLTRSRLAARGLKKSDYWAGTAPTYKNYQWFLPTDDMWTVELSNQQLLHQVNFGDNQRGPYDVQLPRTSLHSLVIPPTVIPH